MQAEEASRQCMCPTSNAQFFQSNARQRQRTPVPLITPPSFTRLFCPILSGCQSQLFSSLLAEENDAPRGGKCGLELQRGHQTCHDGGNHILLLLLDFVFFIALSLVLEEEKNVSLLMLLKRVPECGIDEGQRSRTQSSTCSRCTM